MARANWSKFMPRVAPGMPAAQALVQRTLPLFVTSRGGALFIGGERALIEAGNSDRTTYSRTRA